MEHSPKFLALVTSIRKRIREMTVEMISKRVDAAERSFILIDVREDHEWQRGHIPGAQHLGKGVLERDIEKLIPSATSEIILYCGGGYRSALAADALQQMGYQNVYSMDGGYRGWTEAGLPIEK